MPKSTKTFLIIWLTYMIGVHWKWWPLESLMAGVIVLAAVLSWIIVSIAEWDANQPPARKRY